MTEWFNNKQDLTKISPALVKRFLGGEWPEFHGFNFDAVCYYRLEDGLLVPYDGFGDIVPGPSFELTVVDDVFCES